jgi:hypothetical protein
VSAPAEKRPLTQRQRLFVIEYLKDFRVQAAAERAGYSKRDTGAGSKVMALPYVRAEIERRILKIEARLELSADQVRQGFARIATDPRSAFEGGPTVTERLTAYREYGKLLGLYSERHIFVGVTLDQMLAAIDDPSLLPALPGATVRQLTGPTTNGANGHEPETDPEADGGS